MNKLQVFFLVCVIACIASCTYCDDCNIEESKLPVYANNSGETVKITASGYGVYHISDNDTIYKIYEKVIADSDTLYYNEEGWAIPEINNCGFAFNCDYPLEVRMELHFLGEPVKCLIFDGPIKNDGIDTRSIKSYKKGKEIDGGENWHGVEYVYTITPEIMATATEEACEDSISE